MVSPDAGIENRWGDLDSRLILDNLPTMVCAMTAAGELEFVNRAVLEYFSKTAEELRHWDTIGCVHPEDLPDVIAAVRRAGECAGSHNTQQRLRRADGEYRWFQSRAHAARDADGEIVRWLAVLTDIEDVKDLLRTEVENRTKIEERLGESQSFLLEAQRLSHTGSWNHDLVSGTVSITPEMARMFAIQQEEDSAIAEFLFGRIHPEDRPGEQANYARAVSEKCDFESDYRIILPDGSVRYIHNTGHPKLNHAGAVIGFVGTAIDITDQAMARAELRAFIGGIPMLAWSTDPNGSVDFLNQRWLDYTGLSLEQAMGFAWTVALHPDDRDGLISYWQSIMISGQAGEYEARLRSLDGVYRWFLFRANPLRDDSGRIVKWYGINADIEDSKQAEESFRENERNLRATINAIPTPAWSTRPDGHVEFLNQRWLDYAGMTAEQALGWGWGTVVHPDDAGRLLRQWELCRASGTAAEVEARHRRFDGVYRWFLVRANPLLDESGNVVKWYGTNIDIEDRKQAEETLRASERNLRAIIDTMPTLSWSTRSDGFVEFLSQRWLRYTGLTEEQALGFGWAVAINPDDAPRLLKYWQNALDSGTEVDVEARLRRFDGAYRWFLFRASPLRDDSGKIVKWYGTNIDIEDRKQADEALRDSEVRLGRATQRATVGELAASIAHEINQPLAAVVASGHACLRFLTAQPSNVAGAREAAESIVQDAKDAGEVVRRIRALFRRSAVDKTLVSLNEVIREVLHLLSGELAKRGVLVETDLSDDLPSALADRVQLQQLMLNLILNGMEAMDSVHDRPRQLFIRSVNASPKSVLVSVRDQGTGLDDPERVFEAFVTSKENGMGMGLTICRSIVEAHAGRLWVAEAHGPGATFCFELPTKEDAV